MAQLSIQDGTYRYYITTAGMNTGREYKNILKTKGFTLLYDKNRHNGVCCGCLA